MRRVAFKNSCVLSTPANYQRREKTLTSKSQEYARILLSACAKSTWSPNAAGGSHQQKKTMGKNTNYDTEGDVLLDSIFPSAADGIVGGAYPLHQTLDATLSSMGHHRVGTAVAPPSLGHLRALRVQEEICFPLFDCMMLENKNHSHTPMQPHGDLHVSEASLQFVEMGLLIEGVEASMFKEASSATSRAVATRFLNQHIHRLTLTPALIVSESRFPYCAPHGAALAADLVGTTHVILGSGAHHQPQNAHRKESIEDLNFAEHGAVLTSRVFKNGAPSSTPKPVAVGYGRNVLTQPGIAVQKALEYSSKFSHTKMRGGVGSVLCCGWSDRIFMEPGCQYSANFGVLGEATINVKLQAKKTVRI